MARDLRGIGAWLVAGGMVIGAVAMWLEAVPPPAEPTSPGEVGTTARSVRLAMPDRVETMATLAERNPFRLDHLHPSARSDDQVSYLDVPEPMDARSFELSLAGIVGDPPRLVLVEGVPGRESGVLVGWMEVDGLRIVSVRDDSVVVYAGGELRALTLKTVWR
jgi:hypothetical protein